MKNTFLILFLGILLFSFVKNETSARPGEDEVVKYVKSISGAFLNSANGTFTNEVTQKKITGSAIFISGVIEKGKNRRNPCDLLRKFLEQKGWKSDIQFEADGPTGTQYSFTKNGMSCSVIGQWDGEDPSNPKYIPKDVYHIVIYYGK